MASNPPGYQLWPGVMLPEDREGDEARKSSIALMEKKPYRDLKKAFGNGLINMANLCAMATIFTNLAQRFDLVSFGTGFAIVIMLYLFGLLF